MFSGAIAWGCIDKFSRRLFDRARPDVGIRSHTQRNSGKQERLNGLRKKSFPLFRLNSYAREKFLLSLSWRNVTRHRSWLHWATVNDTEFRYKTFNISLRSSYQTDFAIAAQLRPRTA